jgi:hypothetical protein
LRDIEERWVESNFVPDRPQLLEWLKQAARKPRA